MIKIGQNHTSIVKVNYDDVRHDTDIIKLPKDLQDQLKPYFE